MSTGSWRTAEVTLLLSLLGTAVACEAERIWPEGRPLAASILVFALAAVGVMLRLRAAWLFSMLFFSAVAALSSVLIVMLAPEAMKNLHTSDIGPLGGLLLIALGIFFLVVGTACLRGAITSFRVWRHGELRGRSTWLALPVAVAMLSILVWSLGFQYFYRTLWIQHECRSGAAESCILLANHDHFDLEEKRDFARKACELGLSYGCTLSLGKSVGTDGDAAAEKRCAEGDTKICLAIGEARLQGGDAAAARQFLELACEQHKDSCGQAANFAAYLGNRDLHESLARRGCELGDGTSCIAILRHFSTDLDSDTRNALQLKTCLLTDVSECVPLIDSNAEAYCPTICEANENNRRQSCYFCGLKARETGREDLARTWFNQSCSNGFSLACEALGLEPGRPQLSTGPEVTVGEIEPASAEAILWLRREHSSGTAVLVVDERRLAESRPGLRANVEQVCAFDPKGDQWRLLSWQPAGPRVVHSEDRADSGADRVFQEFPAEPGLYWVRWTEQAMASGPSKAAISASNGSSESSAIEYSGWVTVGPILCNDVLIMDVPPDREAVCVPFADHAEARLVPDPRGTCPRQ